MRYGLQKKLTSWRFWLRAISFSLPAWIFADWIILRFFDKKTGWGSFWLFFSINVFVFAAADILTDKISRKSWLFADETDFDEVEKKVKKNKDLWNKIEAIRKAYLGEFPNDYPPRREILVNYKKNHKLKPWERDYVNWKLEFYDERLEVEKDWYKTS